jgi:hypothetical protein
MRLTEYGRNPHKRKAYVHQPDLLLVGVAVSQATHSACLGTPPPGAVVNWHLLLPARASGALHRPSGLTWSQTNVNGG